MHQFMITSSSTVFSGKGEVTDTTKVDCLSAPNENLYLKAPEIFNKNF